MTSLNKPVLVLNKNWMRVRVATVKKCLKLIFAEKASFVYIFSNPINIDGIDDYSILNWEEWSKLNTEKDKNVIVTTRYNIKVPEVIVLSRYDKIHRRRAQLTKKNIYIRDKYCCQYSGRQLKQDEADIDHINPRSKGGKNSWDNLVVCDKDINRIKGDRTPEEAGLTLIKKPTKPVYSQIMIDPKIKKYKSWDKFL